MLFHARATTGNCHSSRNVPDSKLMAYIFWSHGVINVTPSKYCRLPVSSIEKNLPFQESLLDRT